MHDASLVTYAITFFHSSTITLSSKITNSNMNMVPKLNTNIKPKLSLNWFKYVDIKILDNNREGNSKFCNKIPPKLDGLSYASNEKFL
jgi:hypothetical protein